MRSKENIGRLFRNKKFGYVLEVVSFDSYSNTWYNARIVDFNDSRDRLEVSPHGCAGQLNRGEVGYYMRQSGENWNWNDENLWEEVDCAHSFWEVE